MTELKITKWVHKNFSIRVGNKLIRLITGKCLERHAIFVNCLDENHQKRFFPVGVEYHFYEIRDMNYWYEYSQYYNVSQGSLDCCSDTIVGMHYIQSNEMLLLDYLIYQVHPFGLEKNLTEKLSSKLSLYDVVKASEVESFLVPLFEERRRLLRLKIINHTLNAEIERINEMSSFDLMSFDENENEFIDQ